MRFATQLIILAGTHMKVNKGAINKYTWTTGKLDRITLPKDHPAKYHYCGSSAKQNQPRVPASRTMPLKEKGGKWRAEKRSHNWTSGLRCESERIFKLIQRYLLQTSSSSLCCWNCHLWLSRRRQHHEEVTKRGEEGELPTKRAGKTQIWRLSTGWKPKGSKVVTGRITFLERKDYYLNLEEVWLTGGWQACSQWN